VDWSILRSEMSSRAGIRSEAIHKMNMPETNRPKVRIAKKWFEWRNFLVIS